MMASRLPVRAQAIPAADTTVPPTAMKGLTGYMSASRPKTRVERATPRMTMDTVWAAREMETPNSACSTGSTGWTR
ncbi:hypothetical protein DSECCO2_610740 [anaerobic digester metagenome]